MMYLLKTISKHIMNQILDTADMLHNKILKIVQNHISRSLQKT